MTPRIGDIFPPNARAVFSVNAIKPGTVLRTHVDDTTPPKIKLFVVLAVNETQTSVASLYINSDVNPNMFHREELKNLHLPPSGDMIPSYSGCFVDAVNPNPFSSIKKLNQSFLPLYFLPSI